MSRPEQPEHYLRLAVALLAYAVLDSAPARAVDGQDQETLPSSRAASSPFDPWTELRDVENARAALATKGIQFQLIYFGDLLGNLSGGVRQGATYVGRLGLVIDSDLEKLLAWSGATFHASIHQIHG